MLGDLIVVSGCTPNVGAQREQCKSQFQNVLREFAIAALGFVRGAGPLVALCLVAMPLKYIGGNSAPVNYIGIAHGWLYPVLLIAAYNLGRHVQWPWQRLLAIALAGTIPFLSFVAEHFATKDVRRRVARIHGDGVSA